MKTGNPCAHILTGKTCFNHRENLHSLQGSYSHCRDFLARPLFYPLCDAVFIQGAIGGKTSKTAVLPRFCKIECGGGSSGAPPCYGGLNLPGRACHAGGTPVYTVQPKILKGMFTQIDTFKCVSPARPFSLSRSKNLFI